MSLSFRLSIFLLLIASAVSAQLNRFAGAWENIDSRIQEVTALNISVEGNFVTVQAKGKRNAEDYDWGQVEATAYALSPSASLVDSAQALSAVFQTEVEQMLLIIHFVKDRLQVEALTRFPNRSKPTNYLTAYTFVRQIRLTATTIPSFIEVASRSDSAVHLKIREKIDNARQDSTLLPPLFDEFDKARANDFGKSLIILGIIGELKNPQATGRLLALINEQLPPEKDAGHGALSQREVIEMLQSKAVEGLAYLRTRTSDSLTLSIIQKHPSVAVRATAIDAYLYNHGDSLEAKQRLRTRVRPEDRPFLDRVRRTSAISREDFDKGLSRFYQLHPEAVAPEPQIPPRDTGALRGYQKILFWLPVILLVIFVLALVVIFIIIFRKWRKT
ncbi:hypothetical protein L0337_02440 [candidate division KSB1 bacterium]|nr:hypothetical protein [candidate division KSB1 bacterium]